MIGAGPAGLAAAIAAAEAGSRVLVLEQMPRPGLKLLASGGGRCNLTNRFEVEDLARPFGRQWRFMLDALYNFPPEALIAWFEERGVAIEFPDGFHAFPKSGRAADVLAALLRTARELGVEIQTSRRVTSLLIAAGAVAGVRTADGAELRCDRVIVAAGGKGYPELGALGIGYELAARAGHTIVPPLPAMVGLCVTETWAHDCAGIALADAEARIALAGESKTPDRGELLFTQNGLSGPAVLDLSGRVSELLTKHPAVPLEINFFAGRSVDDWLAQFNRWQGESGKKLVRNLLAELLPKKLAGHLSADLGEVAAANFGAAARRELANRLSGCRFAVTATESWRKAMVTRGGVALREVAPDTLESRLTAGLYFAGEVLDLDGPCGGYNLQWAFSSGRLAGSAAGERAG